MTGNSKKTIEELINAGEIDINCIDMVRFFNEVGLPTKFSCEGHDILNSNFCIMFDDSVTDSDIENFIEYCSMDKLHTPLLGRFTKWMRKMSGEVKTNWEYSVSTGDWKRNQYRARHDLDIMKSKRKDCGNQ